MQKIIMLVLIITATITANAQKAAVYAPKGKAIKGYDAVAFFTEHKAIAGQDSLTLQWNNATWYFNTKEHLEAFKKTPDTYAPQYGGYCAYGTADGDGHKAPTDTDTWTIVDDKLYFNYNKSVKNLWLKQQQNYILQANKNWPIIKDKE